MRKLGRQKRRTLHIKSGRGRNGWKITLGWLKWNNAPAPCEAMSLNLKEVFAACNQIEEIWTGNVIDKCYRCKASYRVKDMVGDARGHLVCDECYAR